MKRLGVYNSRQLLSYWYVFRWRLRDNGMAVPNHGRGNLAANDVYRHFRYGIQMSWCDHGALFAQSPNLHNFRLNEFLRERVRP